MSGNGRLPNRIPADKVSATRWTLPEVAEGVVIPAEARQVPRPEEEVISLPASTLASGKLTAQELEALAHAAEEEGRQAGHAEGYAEGFRQGREQGEREGHEQGHREAYQATYAEYLSRSQRLASVLSQLMEPLAEQQAEIEHAMADIVRELARAVVGRELSEDSRHIPALVRQCVEAVPLGASRLKVLVHPDDLALVEEQGMLREGWSLQADASVGRGGCRVETAESKVDYSVAQRLAAILSRWEFHPHTAEQCLSSQQTGEDEPGLAP